MELVIHIKMDLALNNLGWYAIKPNKLNKPNQPFLYI